MLPPAYWETQQEGRTKIITQLSLNHITKWAGSDLCLPLKNGLATRGHSGKRIPSKPPCPPLGVEANLVSFLEWARREERAEGRKPLCI